MIRIIGLGSPFGDDRVGLRVIQLLAGRLPETIDLVTLDRPGSTLINWMQGVEHLVLIDAIVSGAAPGSLIRLTAADLPVDNPRLSSHQPGLRETLRLAEALGTLPEKVEIFGIELGDCHAEALNQAVEAAATRLASHVVEQLA
jgi:hydrogenase maturation protease